MCNCWTFKYLYKYFWNMHEWWSSHNSKSMTFDPLTQSGRKHDPRCRCTDRDPFQRGSCGLLPALPHRQRQPAGLQTHLVRPWPWISHTTFCRRWVHMSHVMCPGIGKPGIGQWQVNLSYKFYSMYVVFIEKKGFSWDGNVAYPFMETFIKEIEIILL